MDPVRDKNMESSGSPSASVSNGMDFFKRYISWVAPFAFGAFLFFGCVLVLAPPSTLPSRDIVVIAQGASVSDIAKELYDAHIIAHPTVLRLILRMSGASNRVQAGAYLFNVPENALVVAHRLVTGTYGLPPVRITFIEGVTVREMAVQVTGALPKISTKDFLSAGQPYEGYLFPDTYFFSSSADVASVVASMRANFTTKIASLSGDMSVSGHSLSDVVIMASLVEKEARTTVNRHIVAGILWNRLKLGMPLQVDAVFGYIYGRDTYSPSLADLKVVSPYNTYTHTGLPPGPIDNPGLDSLDATIHPTKTDYLYYLTGKDDLMHYATTYAGHQANRKRYLY
jgi:UPF0755 protein